MGEAPEQKLLEEHKRQVAEVRSDKTLSWEKRELTIRRMGQRLSERLRQLEERS